jgi:peptidoglycan/LPS O-acetylase OafA/YrhL
MNLISAKRNETIDFLRFVGCILVIFNHLYVEYNTGLITKALYFLKTGGWVGVDLFFVLSGFLVSNLIFKEYEKTKSFNAKRFLIRRGFKIYPGFYSLLFFTALVNFSELGNLKNKFLTESLFISNYTAHLYGHTWSLCIEEHFYFFLSLLMFVLIRIEKLNIKVIFAIFLCFLLSSFFLRYYANNGGYDFYKQYARSHFRFDSLFFGVLLCNVFLYHKAYLKLVYRYKFLFLIIALAFVLTNFLFQRVLNPWISILSLGLNPIFFGIILILALEIRNSACMKIMRPIAFLGRYSYSIYLFHEPVNEIVHNYLFRDHYLLYYISYVALSVLVGVVLGKLIEFPFLMFRDKYFPSTNSLIPERMKS